MEDKKALMQCTASFFISVAAFLYPFSDLFEVIVWVLVAVARQHHLFTTEVGFYVGCISRDFRSVLRVFRFKNGICCCMMSDLYIEKDVTCCIAVHCN